MKILQVVHRFPRDGGAGAENYTRQLCDALASISEVAVITRDESYLQSGGPPAIRQDAVSGYPVYLLQIPPKYSRRIENNYWDERLDDCFISIVKKTVPDVIHFQHAAGLSLSWVRAAAGMGFPVFMTLHDYWLLCPSITLRNQHGLPCLQPRSTMRCWLCQAVQSPGPHIIFDGYRYIKQRNEKIRSVVSDVKMLLAPSLFLKNTFIECGFPESRILHYPHGIDHLSRYIPKDVSSKLHDPVVFGYIGTFAPHKGVGLLLEVFSDIPATKAQLLIFGHAGQNKTMKSISESWVRRYSGGSIRFMGPFHPEDLPRIHSEIDVTIAPSIWFENRPLAVLESLAAGNPVLGSRIGGIPELLNPLGDDFLFNSDDKISLSKKIGWLLTNPDIIRSARANIPRIRDIREEAPELLSLYRKYSGQPPRLPVVS